MSSYIVTCVLLMIATVHAVPSFTRNYTSSHQLLPTYEIHWTVNQTSQEIYLGFKVQTTGWFGFGIAEPSSGSMPGADIMTANVTNGRTVVTDRFSTAKALPPADEQCGDWVAVNGDESDGWTLVEVTRKLDTGDHVQDRVIAAGSIPIIFSYSSANSDQLSYHGSNRGTGFITFYGTTTQITDIKKDPTVTVSFPQVSNFTIPPQQTTYMCQAFQLPADQVRHIIAFEPVVNSDDATMVHHAIIHGCIANASFVNQYQTPGECESPIGNLDSGCTDILFAWARGGESFVLPSEAGFRVSNGTNGGTIHIILQYHYDNPKFKSGSVDRSGFKIYMTSQLRPHDAGVVALGDVFSNSHAIPAGAPYTEYEYACSPTCTQQMNTSLQVFGDLPHMHAYGDRIWTTHWRNGTQLVDAQRTEYFAWTYQRNINVNYTILPGDRLNTHCGYNTKSATKDVTFGKNSTQEMCLEFLSYWPKQENFFYCGGYRIPELMTNISVCGPLPLLLNASDDQSFEVNNPDEWGYDPIIQRLRSFGNDIHPSGNVTCPWIKDIVVVHPTDVPSNTTTAPPTNTTTAPPTNGSSSSTGGSDPTHPIHVNTASTTTPIIISFIMGIMVVAWN